MLYFKQFKRKKSKHIIFLTTLFCFFLSLMLLSSIKPNFSVNSESANDKLIYRAFAFKSSPRPVLLINSPINYASFSNIAPNFSITIIDGIGKYFWYEFLETGDTSVPIELNGILKENISDTFDQNLWNKLSNGDITIRFYVVNSFGKEGHADMLIKKNIVEPMNTNFSLGNSIKSLDSNTLGFIIQIWLSLIYIFIFFRRYFKGSKERIYYTLLGLCFFLLILFSITKDLIFEFKSNNIQDRLIFDEKSLKLSTPPIIQINSPINNDLFNKTAPNFSITIIEGLANWTWYEFVEIDENSSIIELEGIAKENVTGTFDQNMWNNIPNETETLTIRFYANNSLGEINQEDVIVRVDKQDPIINILKPIGGYFNSTAPEFTVEISDSNLNKTWYTLNTNTTKHFFEDNGSINQLAWNILPEGIVNITFFANDSVSNLNSALTQVNKDITPPAITIISPTSGYYNATVPEFEVEIWDDNIIDKRWYIFNTTSTKHFFLSNGSLTGWGGVP
ncbi:MAG: hypothetical protein ACFFCE_19025, partial [Promethearchaeota archaeon]